MALSGGIPFGTRNWRMPCHQRSISRPYKSPRGALKALGLDLFRDHPEEIVIAEKVGLEAKFTRLSDRADLEEILGDAPLSEVWYSGVLGGVPAGA